MEKHPLHFKSPELQTSPEVGRAVERKKRTGEKVPNNPSDRIEAYMDRLENIFLNPDQEKRERNIDRFRDQIYDALLIKRDNFPESYFELQKRVARGKKNRFHGLKRQRANYSYSFKSPRFGFSK